MATPACPTPSPSWVWLLLRWIDEPEEEKIDRLDRQLGASARAIEESARLMTIPRPGPITALGTRRVRAADDERPALPRPPRPGWAWYRRNTLPTASHPRGDFALDGTSISPHPSAVTMDGPRRTLLQAQQSTIHDIMESIDDNYQGALAVKAASAPNHRSSIRR